MGGVDVVEGMEIGCTVFHRSIFLLIFWKNVFSFFQFFLGRFEKQPPQPPQPPLHFYAAKFYMSFHFFLTYYSNKKEREEKRTDLCCVEVAVEVQS